MRGTVPSTIGKVTSKKHFTFQTQVLIAREINRSFMLYTSAPAALAGCRQDLGSVRTAGPNPKLFCSPAIATVRTTEAVVAQLHYPF